MNTLRVKQVNLKHKLLNSKELVKTSTWPKLRTLLLKNNHVEDCFYLKVPRYIVYVLGVPWVDLHKWGKHEDLKKS